MNISSRENQNKLHTSLSTVHISLSSRKNPNPKVRKRGQNNQSNHRPYVKLVSVVSMNRLYLPINPETAIKFSISQSMVLRNSQMIQ